MQRIDIDDPDVDFDDWQTLLYRGESFTGEVAEYHPEGGLVSLESYIDGLVDGPSKSWYPDGTPRSEGQTSHGHPVGQWQEWHPNGRLHRTSTFSSNGDVLTRREFDDAGILVTEYPESQ